LITTTEIARQAGVSRAAVSYVIHDRRDQVSAETRRRVMKIVREHDYHPNALVQALRRKRTGVAGVLVPGLYVSFFAEIVDAMEVAARTRGWRVVICQTHGQPDHLEQEITKLRELRVDGFIVCPLQSQRAYYKRLVKAGVKMVFLDDAVPNVGVPYVDSDDVCGGRLATEHLLGLGHRRIACLRLSAPALPNCRFAGYRAALSDAGVAFDERLVTELDQGNYETGFGATGRLLAGASFTALVAPNDVMAIAAIDALRQAGRRVPDDVSVVGYANLREASYCRPKLTTVSQETGAIGREAANRLLDLIEERPVGTEDVLVKPRLIVRESTAGVANT
jgi:DNA-binding LacI/PurR family transcriptional regulator